MKKSPETVEIVVADGVAKPEGGSARPIEARPERTTGVHERGMHTQGLPGNSGDLDVSLEKWERARHARGPGLVQSADALHRTGSSPGAAPPEGAGGIERSAASTVGPERPARTARPDARREVVTAHGTDETGEPVRRDPAEGRGSRSTEPRAGKAPRMPSLDSVSTKRARIAQLAKEDPNRALTSLAHYIDIEWLREAYRLTRKDGAPGVD